MLEVRVGLNVQNAGTGINPPAWQPGSSPERPASFYAKFFKPISGNKIN